MTSIKQLNERLREAARFGKTEDVLELISNGADINCSENDGRTPLHWASEYGCTATAVALITAGADVNIKGKAGNTPLHLASRLGVTEIVIALIPEVACIHEINKSGYTPINLASRFGNKQATLALIAYGAHVSQVHEYQSQLRTLSMRQAAAQGGFTERMLELLREQHSSPPQDAPEALAALARQHGKHDTAAAIQSFIAACAIESMLKGTSLAKSSVKGN